MKIPEMDSRTSSSGLEPRPTVVAHHLLAPLSVGRSFFPGFKAGSSFQILLKSKNFFSVLAENAPNTAH